MSYLIRLARRATGLSLVNSLKPNNAHHWGNTFDPFDNVEIQPLAYPDTSSHQGGDTHTTNAREDVSIPRPNHQRAETHTTNASDQHNDQNISHAKKTEIKTVSEITKQDGGKPSRSAERLVATKADNTAVKNLSKQRPPLKQPGKTTQRDVTGSADPAASKIKTALLSQQSVTTSHQRAKNDGPEAIKMSSSQLFRRLAGKAIASTQVTTKPRSAKQQTMDRTATIKEPEDLTLAPQRIEASNKVSQTSTVPHRRKAPAAQTEDAPRLIIGSLKVDVVPVANKTNHREFTQSVTSQPKKNNKQSFSQHAAKMKFGLGQM